MPSNVVGTRAGHVVDRAAGVEPLACQPVAVRGEHTVNTVPLLDRHRPVLPVDQTHLVVQNCVSTGTSHAGLDNELSLVDGQDRTLTIQQWDTFLNGVFPLDRNRLTREWFHSGRAKYNVAGAGADEFEGTLELGYQIGFPWSLGVGINFSYTTPNILLDDASLFPVFNPLGSVITPNLFPGVSISADLGNGPGIQEVATFSVDVAGPAGGGSLQRAWHGDRCRRWRAAASVRTSHLVGR